MLSPMRRRRLWFVLPPRPTTPTLFPYTTLFRSDPRPQLVGFAFEPSALDESLIELNRRGLTSGERRQLVRSEEHTSELQSLRHLVCRLLLENKTAYLSFYGGRTDILGLLLFFAA